MVTLLIYVLLYTAKCMEDKDGQKSYSQMKQVSNKCNKTIIQRKQSKQSNNSLMSNLNNQLQHTHLIEVTKKQEEKTYYLK